MLNSMGSSSAILRRRIFGAGNFRSNRIPIYSIAGKRMISSASGVSSFESAPAPASAPWLMFKPNLSETGRLLFRFLSLSENRIYNFFTYKYQNFSRNYWRFVGSSHGWLGVYDEKNHDLWLADPMTDLLVKLPPIGSVVHRLFVVDEGRLAVAAQGSGGSLAFCSLPHGTEWTSLASERAYDCIAYSSRDNVNRLLCLTHDVTNNMNLEIWGLAGIGKAPALEWNMCLDVDLMSDSDSPYLKKLKYIVCSEQSGELFVVVRYVEIRHEFIEGSFVKGLVDTEFKFNERYEYEPYITTEFKVYKVDRKRQQLILMRDSLQGLAIFVGTNLPRAIPAAGLVGVKPDSVYFTFDRRIKYAWGLPCDGIVNYRYGYQDFGIFNYTTKDFLPVALDYNTDPDYIDELMWFTSRSPHI